MLGYSGVFIQDALSEGIEIKSIISHETRSKAAKSIRHLMTSVVKDKSSLFQDSVKNIREVSEALEHLIDEILNSDSHIINIIDMKGYDSYTYQHSVNVCILACVIGIGYDMDRSQLRDLALSAIFHDIGKMFIDKKLLDKPGELTDEEFEVMKTHASIGIDKLNLNNILSYVVTSSILQHHEKFNGDGYPFGRKAMEIPLNAQLVSIADVYDALTTHRPYRSPLLPSEAYEYILGNSGQAFNPELVKVFMKKIAPFPLGVQVLLSNGQSGIVYKNYEDNLLRPLIKIIPDTEQPGDFFVDLKNDVDSYNVTIEKVFM
jgi:HD-GYP domain-containing protein (c-di-GMP phosphodiesterase class II)